MGQTAYFLSVTAVAGLVLNRSGCIGIVGLRNMQDFVCLWVVSER